MFLYSISVNTAVKIGICAEITRERQFFSKVYKGRNLMLFFEDGDLVVVGLFMGSCVRIKKQPTDAGCFLCSRVNLNRES